MKKLFLIICIFLQTQPKQEFKSNANWHLEEEKSGHDLDIFKATLGVTGILALSKAGYDIYQLYKMPRKKIRKDKKTRKYTSLQRLAFEHPGISLGIVGGTAALGTLILMSLPEGNTNPYQNQTNSN